MKNRSILNINNFQKYGLFIVLFHLSFIKINSQSAGYTKDSLQIKVYTEIVYKNNQVKQINVKKVFCDYCSNVQVDIIKKRAYDLTFNDRNSPENRKLNGIKKLALYIRISKKDFKAFRENE
ncbi:MAG: hypothetical protein L3J09_03225 [Flavobacteriaceae bacterium]|nr:hypothetical protein [Flavobacteriaceae bacterium]